MYEYLFHRLNYRIHVLNLFGGSFSLVELSNFNKTKPKSLTPLPLFLGRQQVTLKPK